ncbi:MAG: PspA-associated protein PspAB [Thermoleophilaceae bacterium]
MGFLDAVFGGSKKLKGPAPDRVFAMTTAYVTMQTAHGIESTGAAGIVFQPLATSDFEQILKDAEELLRGTAEESGTTLESSDDEHGYRWIILRDDDFDDLVVSLNTISTELQAGGYGDRLLCAVFAFGGGDAKPTYFIYNYKRGKFYPFVPAKGEQQRDSEHELRLKAQLDKELPIEPELTRWFPLWEIPL